MGVYADRAKCVVSLLLEHKNLNIGDMLRVAPSLNSRGKIYPS